MKKSAKVAMMILLISILFVFPVFAKDDPGEGNYTLEQVVVLSRHNLRAPLQSNGSVPQELTPHSWIKWTAGSSELTVKGGIEETAMGEYFRKWLDEEGLISENSIPGDEEVRFNARDKQRCRATARYFAAGMLPMADITVEYPDGQGNTEDFMKPNLKFYSDSYAADAVSAIEALGGDKGFDGITDEYRDAIKLIMDTVDMQDSDVYKSGKYGDLLADSSGYTMEDDKEPDVTGAIKTASQVADALVLQYYEEPDALKAAFGHELSDEDWDKIGGFLSDYLKIKHGTPLIAENITHPLIEELNSELKNENRKFSFFCAHDCTVMGTLAALGAEPYELPDSIESYTPIGVKLLFERWSDKDGQAWYRVRLLYRSTEQIRDMAVLTPDNPPLRYDLSFKGVKTNEDGLISAEDFFGMFDRTIAGFDELKEKYTAKDTEAETVKDTNDGTNEEAETTSGNVLDNIRKNGVLRVGTAGDYQPMSYLDPETGTYTGFDVELAEDLAKSLGVETEYVKTSWPTLMEDTLAGKFDLAICGITVTDARKEQALMSEGYFKNGKTVLCRAEDADKYTSLEAINKADVRVMENPGGLNEKFARENLPEATLIIHDVNQEIPGLIASGEADVMITEIMEAGFYVGRDSRLAAPLIYEPFTNGQLGVLMQKGSEDLLAYVNDFIEEEKDSGRIDELADEYIYRYIDKENKAAGKDNEKIINFEDKRKFKPGLKYWDKDSEAMQSIMKFVKEATDKTSEGYIPKEDRIAVFDMDGTLTCETFYTYYDTMMFINFCLEDHPERVSEELKEAAREIKPGYMAGEELARNFAKAYAGMTVEELYDYAVEFGKKKTDSFNNMRYIDGFYLPMVEVVKYLYDNDFTIYVVSGTERTTTRAIVDNSPISEYVSPSHVIGTEFEVKVKGHEDVSSNMDYKYTDGDELVFTGGFIQKNLNANKTIWIEREIGRRPVLAFGNSGSDTSMLNYVLDERNPYPSAAYMVVADDDVREWGTQNWDEKSAQYKEQGYVPISMKNDFTKIYPAPVKRSDEQYREPQPGDMEDQQQDGNNEVLDDAA